MSKVIRIEQGAVGISTTDLKALLEHYGIRDTAELDRLVALARASKRAAWWSQYKGLVGPELLNLLSYESSASNIRQFEPLLMPSLLQTDEYARSVIGVLADLPVGDKRLKSLVDLRMERRELLERPSPPEAHFILDEAVIRRTAENPAASRSQLCHLREMADRPSISLLVVPFAKGLHQGLRGSFVILEFPDVEDDDVLYLESTAGDKINREDQDEIATYREIFARLTELAGSKEDAIAIIDDAIARL